MSRVKKTISKGWERLGGRLLGRISKVRLWDRVTALPAPSPAHSPAPSPAPSTAPALATALPAPAPAPAPYDGCS